MNRKDFIKLAAITASFPALLVGCNVTEPGSRRHLGAGDRDGETGRGNLDPAKKFSQKIRDDFSVFEDIAKKGEGGAYAFEENGNYFKATVIPDGKIVNHPYLLIEANGKRAYLTWGMDGSYPSFKLLDMQGDDLHEVSFGSFTDTHSHTAWEWLGIALTAAAVLLAVWLGLEIVGFFISFLASVAFFLLVLAALAAGILVIAGIVKLIFDTTQWEEVIKEKIRDSAGWLEDQLRRIAEVRP